MPRARKAAGLRRSISRYFLMACSMRWVSVGNLGTVKTASQVSRQRPADVGNEERIRFQVHVRREVDGSFRFLMAPERCSGRTSMRYWHRELGERETPAAPDVLQVVSAGADAARFPAAYPAPSSMRSPAHRGPACRDQQDRQRSKPTCGRVISRCLQGTKSNNPRKSSIRPALFRAEARHKRRVSQ
jgi:hypothetical protein